MYESVKTAAIAGPRNDLVTKAKFFTREQKLDPAR
jgi:hypothetical protein